MACWRQLLLKLLALVCVTAADPAAVDELPSPSPAALDSGPQEPDSALDEAPPYPGETDQFAADAALMQAKRDALLAQHSQLMAQTDVFGLYGGPGRIGGRATSRLDRQPIYGGQGQQRAVRTPEPSAEGVRMTGELQGPWAGLGRQEVALGAALEEAANGGEQAGGPAAGEATAEETGGTAVPWQHNSQLAGFDNQWAPMPVVWFPQPVTGSLPDFDSEAGVPWIYTHQPPTYDGSALEDYRRRIEEAYRGLATARGSQTVKSIDEERGVVEEQHQQSPDQESADVQEADESPKSEARGTTLYHTSAGVLTYSHGQASDKIAEVLAASSGSQKEVLSNGAKHSAEDPMQVMCYVPHTTGSKPHDRAEHQPVYSGVKASEAPADPRRGDPSSRGQPPPGADPALGTGTPPELESSGDPPDSAELDEGSGDALAAESSADEDRSAEPPAALPSVTDVPPADPAASPLFRWARLDPFPFHPQGPAQAAGQPATLGPAWHQRRWFTDSALPPPRPIPTNDPNAFRLPPPWGTRFSQSEDPHILALPRSSAEQDGASPVSQGGPAQDSGSFETHKDQPLPFGGPPVPPGLPGVSGTYPTQPPLPGRPGLALPPLPGDARAAFRPFRVSQHSPAGQPFPAAGAWVPPASWRSASRSRLVPRQTPQPAPWVGPGRPPAGPWPWPALSAVSRGPPAAVPSSGVYPLYAGWRPGAGGGGGGAAARTQLQSQWYRPAVVPLPGGGRALPNRARWPRPAVAMATSEESPPGAAADWPAVSMATGGDALVVTGAGRSSGALARAAGDNAWPPMATATAGGTPTGGSYSRASSGGFNLVYQDGRFYTAPMSWRSPPQPPGFLPP